MDRPSIAAWMATAICLTVAVPGSFADSPAACASIKANATGARIGHSVRCFASAVRSGGGIPVDCLASTQSKLSRTFRKADKKGSCGLPDDATLIGSSVTALAEGLALGFFPAGSAESGRACASGKLRRAGAYGKGRLACWAGAFRAGSGADSECEAAVAARLEKSFTKLDATGGCVTAGDQADVAQAMDGFVDAVAGLLMVPGSSTTTTAPPSGSSTTTTTPVDGSTTSTAPDGTTTSTALGATTTTSTLPSVVSLSTHVQPIFTVNCAVAGCHSGVVPAQGLDLRAGHAYASTVSVASGECPLFKRVLPGSPTQSYLVFKITGPPQPCFSGNQMPGGGRSPLSATEQLLIRTWIEQGALNN